MRMLIGMCLGAALVVGVAYVHDSSPALVGTGARPMVNWEVVDAKAAAIEARVSAVWNKLAG